MLNRHPERPPMASGGPAYGLGMRAVLDAMLHRRGMAHGKSAASNGRSGDDLEILFGTKIADLKLTQADDAERWCLDPSDADNAARARSEQGFGGGAGQGKIEDLVGLLARYRRVVKRAQILVRLQGCEGLPQRLGILRREQGALNVASIAEMLQDLLTDELALPVAIGGEDDLIAGLERGADSFELGRFVALRRRPCGVEAVRLEQDA